VRRVPVLAVAIAAALLPAAAGALEPRFDHRDSHGPLVELLAVHDTLVVSGRTTNAWRPAVRAGWGFDVTGEGSELVVSADAALKSWSDPQDDHVLLTGSVRYRTYFGTEEWKTFFEAGVWVPILSRLGVGPLLGVGVVRDFSQDFGVFAGATISTSIGEARVVSLGGLAGIQFRFAIP
jgi:hypothetical protein